MNSDEIRKQSENAYNQWAVKWREHCRAHSKFEMHPMNDLLMSGIGKTILCVANGYSFEEDIDIIRENQKDLDIMCCDKTLGSCIDNGVVPKYCMVCDAVVDHERYLKPWEDKLEGVTLLMNACGNPNWAENGNWKKIYFFVSRDILNSEEEFCKISGCPNKIPAGTNVSNAMVVILTQCDESGSRNFFGYDKILLTGFDYCWGHSKYYAFDGLAGGKNNYMRHIYTANRRDEVCFTSNNLMFSARWLHKYVEVYKIPVVQCSGCSLLTLPHTGDLKDHIGYTYKPSDYNIIIEAVKKKEELMNEIKKINCIMKETTRDHLNSFLASV